MNGSPLLEEGVDPHGGFAEKFWGGFGVTGLEEAKDVAEEVEGEEVVDETIGAFFSEQEESGLGERAALHFEGPEGDFYLVAVTDGGWVTLIVFLCRGADVGGECVVEREEVVAAGTQKEGEEIAHMVDVVSWELRLSGEGDHGWKKGDGGFAGAEGLFGIGDEVAENF